VTVRVSIRKSKASVSYAHCSIAVEGMDFTCPLCGTVVKSGEHHSCAKPEDQAYNRRKTLNP